MEVVKKEEKIESMATGVFDLKMTSREIAELTGKQHKDVMKSIKKHINQCVINGRNFALVEYVDMKGEKRPMYELDHDATMTLVTGYDAHRRMAVIKRWRELEEGKAKPMVEMVVAPSTREETIAQGLVAAQQVLAEKSRALEAAKPAIDFYSAVANTDRLFSVGESAKLMSSGLKEPIGTKTLMTALRKVKVLMKSNEPYQTYIDRGWLAFKLFTPYLTGRPMLTGMGLIKVAQLMKNIETETERSIKSLIAEV